MDITEETATAAGHAAADAYRHWRNTTEVQNLSVLVAQVADAVAARVAPLIAAQALREAALKALAGREPVETALCVGGPFHGTEKPLESDAFKVVMPFEPRTFMEETDVLDDPLRDRVRTYYRQKLSREIDGVRYVRTVWLFDELRAGDRSSMDRVADAVVQQWLAAGTRVPS